MFASLRSKNGSTVIVRCRGHMAAMQRRDCELPSCLRTTHLTLEEAGTRYPSTSARTRTDDARHVQNAQMFADQRPAWLPLRALLFGPGCSMWRSRSIASSMISRLKLAQMEYRLGCSRELCHFEPLRGHNINRIDRPRHEKRDHTRNKYTEGYKEGSANRLRPQRHTTCSASGTRGRLHGNIPHAIFSLVSFRWARPICPAQVKSCHRPRSPWPSIPCGSGPANWDIGACVNQAQRTLCRRRSIQWSVPTLEGTGPTGSFPVPWRASEHSNILQPRKKMTVKD